jgi:hypothetical protein
LTRTASAPSQQFGNDLGTALIRVNVREAEVPRGALGLHLTAAEGIQRILARQKENNDMTSPASHPRDPLHGITLENILNQLVQRHGWSEMGRRIPVRCFQLNPSVKSSLTFLRKTPWARKKVEDWFIGELLPK